MCKKCEYNPESLPVISSPQDIFHALARGGADFCLAMGPSTISYSPDNDRTLAGRSILCRAGLSKLKRAGLIKTGRYTAHGDSFITYNLAPYNLCQNCAEPVAVGREGAENFNGGYSVMCKKCARDFFGR